MNYNYTPPPSASSGALRSFETDYPEQVQPTGPDSYEAPAPNYSAGIIRNSQPQLPGVGQRALPVIESHLLPPQETDVRMLQHSTNQLTGDTGSRVGGESFGGGGPGSLSGFVHPNNSSNGVVGDYYSGGEAAPGISDLANQRDRSSNNGLSGDDTTTTFDSLPNARHSMTGNKFKNAYKLFNQFDS